MFLLDTCCFLWLVADPDRLSAAARKAIQSGEVCYLSSVSVLELGIKHATGKLILDGHPHIAIPAIRERHLLQSLAFTEEAASRIGQLPSIHRDPFDRMLVCQAIEEGLTIITSDQEIHRYPVRCLW